MTSLVTRDDIEAAAHKWRAGRMSIDALLKVIDVYAVSKAHNFSDPADLLPSEPWAHLSPGAWDAKARVTRCYECGKVKNWRGNYDRDSTHPSGFNDICRLCSGSTIVPVPRTHHKRGKEYRCRRCGDDKPLKEFPEAKQLNTSINSWCTSCYEKYGDESSRKFKCRRCNAAKTLNDFPEEKRNAPRLPYDCNDCNRKYGWRNPVKPATECCD